MKIFVVFFLISLSLCVNAFEYHEEYSTEDVDGRSLDVYYKDVGGAPYNYNVPAIPYPYRPSGNLPSQANVIPNEPSVKPVNTVHEITHDATTATENAQTDAQKPIYDLKDAPKLFEKFIKDFNKEYTDDEERNKRYQNFLKNLEEINRLNKEQDATFDINMFADLGEGESPWG